MASIGGTTIKRYTATSRDATCRVRQRKCYYAPTITERTRHVASLQSFNHTARNNLAADVQPLADSMTIADQTSPVGTVGTCVEVDAGGEMVAHTILEGGVGLLTIVLFIVELFRCLLVYIRYKITN